MYIYMKSIVIRSNHFIQEFEPCMHPFIIIRLSSACVCCYH